MKLGGGIAVGLLLAFAAHFLALILSGAGHGWNTPLFASFALWVALPFTFATVSPLGPYPHGDRLRLLLLLCAGIISDLALLWATIDEGTEYFWATSDAGGPNLLWLAIWLSWQLVVLIALTNGEDGPEEQA